jgi:hypothetical protein
MECKTVIRVSRLRHYPPLVVYEYRKKYEKNPSWLMRVKFLYRSSFSSESSGSDHYDYGRSGDRRFVLGLE